MNIDKEIQKFNTKIGLIQVWKVWKVGGGQGYIVTVRSSDRSNRNRIFSHIKKSRALSFASDYRDGIKSGLEIGFALGRI